MNSCFYCIVNLKLKKEGVICLVPYVIKKRQENLRGPPGQRT